MARSATQIFLKAVEAVSPDKLVEKVLHRNGTTLFFNGQAHILNCNVKIVGFGKAICGMCRAVQNLIPEHIKEGAISIPCGLQEDLKKSKSHLLPLYDGKIKVLEGAANNLPDKAAAAAAQEIVRVCRNAKEDELVIALVSGGGSALLPAPKHPLTLKEKCEVIQLLTSKGATIQQLNIVRQALSQVKGGKLISEVYPAKLWAFVISDIIGDPIELIASGPTIPSSDSTPSAIDICNQHKIIDAIPKNAADILRKMEPNHVPKDAVSVNHIIGNNQNAIDAAHEKAVELGYTCILLSRTLHGEARSVGCFLAQLGIYACQCLHGSENEKECALDVLRRLSPSVKGLNTADICSIHRAIANVRLGSEGSIGVCLLAAGETTVNLNNCSGIGGRNQEMVLSAAVHLRKHLTSPLANGSLTFLSAGTDGQDGPTSAAGGVVSSDDLSFDLTLANDALVRHDSHTYFKNMGNLITTGLTGTNVMDLQVLLIH